VSGFHSTIDRPEPLKRVIPPSKTMAKIAIQQSNSQPPTNRLEPGATPFIVAKNPVSGAAWKCPVFGLFL
jgi:hypothetical protein